MNWIELDDDQRKSKRKKMNEWMNEWIIEKGQQQDSFLFLLSCCSYPGRLNSLTI